MSPDDLSEHREGTNQPRASHEHEVGARVGVRRTYYSTASFPVIQSPSLFQAQIKQSLQRLENDQVIILASLGMDEPKGPRARYKYGSRVYIKNVRPSSWPGPPWWTGLSRVLPSTQLQTLYSKRLSSAVQGLCEALQRSSKKTGKTHFYEGDIPSFLDRKWGFRFSNRPGLLEKVQRIMRSCDSEVLRERGLAYETRSGQTLQLMFAVLWGLAQHLDESQNPEYVLQWTAVDWCRVAQIAQSIASKGEKKIFSRATCAQKGATGHYDVIFRRIFPYKPDFNAIRGMFHDFQSDNSF